MKQKGSSVEWFFYGFRFFLSMIKIDFTGLEDNLSHHSIIIQIIGDFAGGRGGAVYLAQHGGSSFRLR